jgi:hypothetical protein
MRSLKSELAKLTQKQKLLATGAHEEGAHALLRAYMSHVVGESNARAPLISIQSMYKVLVLVLKKHCK